MKIKKKILDNQALKDEINDLFNLYQNKELKKAKIYSKKLLKRHPKNYILQNLNGLILSEIGNDIEGISSFKRAININPNNAVGYNNLANVFKKNGKIKLAEIFYNKAILKNPKSPEAYNNLGNLSKLKNNLFEAINYYKKAIEINPNLFVVHNNLGIAYKILGRFNEAKKYFLQSIRIKPNFYYAYRNFGLINKWTVPSQLLETLKNDYTSLKENNDSKREIAFTLGKAHDDIGDYQNAYHYYLDANNLVAKSNSYKIIEESKNFKNIKSIFNKVFFQKTKIKKYKNKVTPIFIVGMPRSGTSLIEQIVTSHSKVFGAGETELFDQSINNICKGKKNRNVFTQNNVKKCGVNYIKKINAISDGSRYITDKLPFNFKWIGLIKLAIPNAKIIHCKRNPGDTIISIFKNYFPYRAMGFAYTLRDIKKYYLLYKDIMHHWKKILPNYIYEVDYENLVNNTEQEVKKLLNYLELEWEKETLKFYKNTRAVHTASDAQVRQPIYLNSIKNWDKYKSFLSEDLKKLDQLLK